LVDNIQVDTDKTIENKGHTMTVNAQVANLLVQILNNEPTFEKSLLGDGDQARDIGSALIRLYSETDSFRTQKLITQFMTEAGYSWLRRLVTRGSDVMAA